LSERSGRKDHHKKENKMLILKLMGLMDFASALFLMLEHFSVIGPFFRPLIGFAIYLLGKAYMYRGDIASMIDLLCGIYLIFAFLGLKTFIAFIVAGYLIQKAFFSMMC